MNSTSDTTLESAWWRNAMQAVSLVCGLALAAVLAFGAPDWTGGPSRASNPVAAAPAPAPKYLDPGPVALYIVDAEADRLALESALSERSIAGGAEASILVAEALGGRTPYDVLSDELDPSVQIIDLTEKGRRVRQ
jgi:hypothetical protein